MIIEAEDIALKDRTVTCTAHSGGRFHGPTQATLPCVVTVARGVQSQTMMAGIGMDWQSQGAPLETATAGDTFRLQR